MNIAQTIKDKLVHMGGGYTHTDFATLGLGISGPATLSNAGANQFDKFFLRPFNPSALFQKNHNYKIYDEARTDDQVGAILKMKKYMILASGWEITIEDESEEPVRELLEWNLTEYLDKSFEQALWEIFTAFDYGFSISEIVFDIVKAGSFKNTMGLRSLPTRPPHGWELSTDKHGNLEFVQQDENVFDPNKFLLFSHNSEFSNPYGESDITLGVYRSWWSKNVIIKLWNMFLEKFGMPMVTGKYDGAITTEDDRKKMLTILKRMQAATVAIMPKEWDIVLEQAGLRTEGGYENAVDKHNTFIGRAMLVPDLMGMSGEKTGGGSFALGVEQFDIFWQTLRKDMLAFERIFNRKIINPIKIANFGEMAAQNSTAKFRFKLPKDKNMLEFAKLWTDAVKGKVWKPSDEEINHFRDISGFPEGDVEQPAAPVMPPQLNSAPLPEKDADEDDIEEAQEFAEFKPFRALTEQEKRIDFQEIIGTTARVEEAAKIRTAQVVKTAINDMISTLKKKKMLENKRFDLASKPPLKFQNKFVFAMKDALREVFKLGVKTANAEVKAPEKFAIIDDIGGLSEEESRKLFESIAASAGTTEWAELQRISTPLLQNAIKNGDSWKKTVSDLGKAFARYDIADNAPRLENIVRTNTNAAFNQGRQVAFNANSDLIEGLQVSAILDDRTTDICVALDGKVYPKGSEDVPPYHFMCRTILVPALIGETITDEQKDIPATDSAGGGFLKLAGSKTFSEDHEKWAYPA